LTMRATLYLVLVAVALNLWLLAAELEHPWLGLAGLGAVFVWATGTMVGRPVTRAQVLTWLALMVLTIALRGLQ